jgi:hypothetical protein
MADILVQKDANNLIPKYGITAAQRDTWALDYTIYDVQANGLKSAPYGPTRARSKAGDLSIDDLGVTRKGPTGEAAPVSGAGNYQPSAIALLGDSYFDNAFGYIPDKATGQLWSYGSHNPFVALNMLLGCPWDLVYNGAVGGTNTNQWLSAPEQLAGVLSSSAGSVLVGFPTNDPDGIQNFATSTANLTEIFSRIKLAGKQILIYTGGNKAAWTGAQRGIALQISDWLVATARANGWPVMDLLSATYDPATAKGSTSLYQSEGGIYTHPNTAGALAAAAGSLPAFEGIFPGRAVQSANGPNQGCYNTAFAGNTSGQPDGWQSFVNGTPTGTSITKVNRTDSPRQLVRITGTSDAAGSRQGIVTIANISLSNGWSTGAKTLGLRIRGSFGDQWVCTTAGTSTGAQPAAMAAASNIGDTAADSGGVVWTRFKNIIPGVSKISARVEVDITNVSGGDLGVNPRIEVSWGGVVVPGAMRANSPPANDIAGQWGFARRRRPVVQAPPVIFPVGDDNLVVRIWQEWTAAGVTSTLDIYGLELRID